MSEFKHDQLFRDATDEERRLIIGFAQAVAHDWHPDASTGGRRFEFTNHFGCQQLFRDMNRMGDKGFLYGALLFSRRAHSLERAVRSHFLTRLALANHEELGSHGPVRECAVSCLGVFLDPLLAEMPDLILEWVEDMETDDPACDLERQPAELIRGLLLSSHVDQRRAHRFWELAAVSPRFPERIFSEPSRHDSGGIFMSCFLKAMGRLFSSAPETAVRRFAAVVRERAVNKYVLVSEDQCRRISWVQVPATELERSTMLASLTSNIELPNRDLAAAILGGQV